MKRSTIDTVLSNEGFTIPEAILALVISMTAIFGLFFVFTYGNEQIYLAGVKEQVLGHLQGEMEKITTYSNYGARDLTPFEKEEEIDLYWDYEIGKPAQ